MVVDNSRPVHLINLKSVKITELFIKNKEVYQLFHVLTTAMGIGSQDQSFSLLDLLNEICVVWKADAKADENIGPSFCNKGKTRARNIIQNGAKSNKIWLKNISFNEGYIWQKFWAILFSTLPIPDHLRSPVLFIVRFENSEVAVFQRSSIDSGEVRTAASSFWL